MDIFNKFSKHILSSNKKSRLMLYYIKHIVTIIILPIFLFNIAFISMFLNSYNDDLYQHVRSITEKNAASLDNLFEDIDTYYKHCLADSDITLLLSNPITLNNIYGQATPVTRAYKNATSLNSYTTCISSVYLYCKKSNYVYGLIGETSSYFDSFPDKAWYDEYMRNNNLNTIALLNNHLTFCYNLGQSENSGVLVIRISQNELFNQLDLVDKNTNHISLVSADGRKLIKYDSSADNNAIKYSSPLKYIDAVIEYSYINKTSSLQQFEKIFIITLFCIISVALTIILAFAFSRKQYKSTISVISAIESPYISNDREADNLYSIMGNTDTSSINTNYEFMLLDKITNLKKAQLIALQTQINPHFLYNTLCMISSTIMINHDEDTDAVMMIELLSNVLRYSLKTENYIVPIENEIDSLKSYVSILKLRHSNSFDVEWNITDEALETCTLKALIQPLIENSVEHGIQPLFCSRKCTITVNAYIENNTLYLNVTDDGIGIEQSKLTELEETLSNEAIFTDINIGLKNVVSRIKLLFGNSAGFKIVSENQKTSVTIYHPIIDC